MLNFFLRMKSTDNKIKTVNNIIGLEASKRFNFSGTTVWGELFEIGKWK